MNQAITIADKEITFALKDFAETQEQLLLEFEKQYHPFKSDLSFLEKPKTGVLKALGEEWKFQKHGLGIFFKGINSGKNIDVHTGGISNKKAFDSWRLYQYFESINCSKISWESDIYVADDDEDLDKILELLNQANIIKPVPNNHNLYELI
jgi:hypothetical protein